MDWTEILQQKQGGKQRKANNAKVEKFLMEVEMSDEVNNVDNFTIKASLLDCLVKYLRSRAIQTRTFHLLNDLVLHSKEHDLFSDDDLNRTFSLVVSSLKVWEGNEYVSTACFEFLATLLDKCVAHDIPDFNDVLLQHALKFLERLRKSKPAVKSIVRFMQNIYEISIESTAHLPVSETILNLVVDILSQYNTDGSISYACCKIIGLVVSRHESYVSTASYKITVVVLATLSSKHSNSDFIKFAGLLLGILRDVVREEKHVKYLIGDETEEFFFICRCITDLKEAKQKSAMTAVLEILLRVSGSSYIESLDDRSPVINSIEDAIAVATRHKESCDARETDDIDRDECCVADEHVKLCDSISTLVKSLKVSSDSSLPSDITEEHHLEQKDNEKPSKNKNLEVHLVSATDLVNSDVVGFSDPYVILKLRAQSVTSKVINNDLNPIFNQKFLFSWNFRDELRIEVWDFDSFKADDPIGHCSVNLQEAQSQLHDESSTASLDIPLEGVPHGRLQMEITFRGDSHEETPDPNEDDEQAPLTNEKDEAESSDAPLPRDHSELNGDHTEQESGDTEASRKAEDSPVNETTLCDDNATDHKVVESKPESVRSSSPCQSFASRSENDEAMMAMIRALRDEVEDWKQKYFMMKESHDALLSSQDNLRSDSFSSNDIEFKSFEHMHLTPSSQLEQDERAPPDPEPFHETLETLHSESEEEDPRVLSEGRDDASANSEDAQDDEHVLNNQSFASQLPSKPNADFAASVSGIKSAFSFCLSPKEGRQVDMNTLMHGKLNKDITNEVAMEIYVSLKWLYQHLRTIQSINVEKMFLPSVLPRSLLRKFLVEDFLQLLHPKKLQVRDVDIILHNVPFRMQFPDFVFAIVACAGKRFAAKDHLVSVKISVLSRLCGLVKAYRQDYHDQSCLDSQEGMEGSEDAPRSDDAPNAALRIPSELREFGLHLLKRQDEVLRQLYYLYASSRRDKRINFESLLVFAKDFNVCPGLMTVGELFEIFEDVFKTKGKSFSLSKQPAINYPEFLHTIFEISVVSNCFGEEDHLFELSTKQNIEKKIYNFLWYVESSKQKKHIREKIILRNFKFQRSKLFVVEDRQEAKRSPSTLCKSRRRQVNSFS